MVDFPRTCSNGGSPVQSVIIDFVVEMNAHRLSKDVFYTATDSVLNVSRFSDMHDAFTSAQKRIADLESENFNLRNKIQNDDHDSMIKHFSKLEVEHFNLQLKYQNLKERFGNKKPVTSSDAPSFVSLFVIGKLNEQIQSRGNTIRELKEKISRLTKKNSDVDPTFDLKALAQLKDNSKYVTIPDSKSKVLAPGVKGASTASRSKPRSNTKKDRTLLAKSALKQVEAHSRMNKSNEKQKNHVDSSISYKRTVVQIDLMDIGLRQLKTMTRIASRSGIVISRILKLPDLDGVDLIKRSRGTNLYTISVEDMMRFSPICLLSKASKNKSWLRHRRLNHLNFGTLNDLARNDLVRGLPQLKFEKDHLCSACQLGKSRKATHKPKKINTIIEVIHTLHMDLWGPLRVTMLIFSKALLFLWAKAIATACYTQNRSLIHTLHDKTPYELVHDKKPDLSFLRVFGALCYPTNNSEDLGKLKAKADIRFFIGYAPNMKGYRIYNKRTRQIMETIYVTFDELTGQTAPVHFSPRLAPIFMTSVHINLGLALQRQMASADNTLGPDSYLNLLLQHLMFHQQRMTGIQPVVSTGTPSSTRINQDTSSTSTSQTTQEAQSHVIPTSVEEDDHGIEVAHMDNDLLERRKLAACSGSGDCETRIHGELEKRKAEKRSTFNKIGLGLKKLFEDGVVKREENMQPTLEVKIARHTWEIREERSGKNKSIFGLKMDGLERVGLGVENGAFGCSNRCGDEMVVGLGAETGDDMDAFGC
ncbi:retrovirus-related pol polyprotein from transposon TNT 1-94 [Tanacetum coccineum]